MRTVFFLPIFAAAILAHGCQQPVVEAPKQETVVPAPPEPWKNTSFQPPRADAAAVEVKQQEIGFYHLPYRYSGTQYVDRKADLITHSLKNQTGGDAGQIALIAFSTEQVDYPMYGDVENGYRGFVFRILNRTAAPVEFGTCDGKLFIVQEAYSDIGGWKPVEYLIWSDCGNSYGSETLISDSYWEFVAPRYDGTFKTRLRFRCDSVQCGDNQPIYSNEFQGSVNPIQFVDRSRSKW